ncbi:hypothetical protein [Streptomyces sp. NPDC058092]|uniref:hypothetical protein n=1 Tax=Streptomyces sp. NPDC058092 TaxID=3346336 RepID=UPI0036E3D112
MTNSRPAHRPLTFDDRMREQYLAAITSGMRLGPAAEAVGISVDIPTRYARTDPDFGRALADAKAIGKKNRQENIPHGEYRYNCHGCRCETCTTAATRARAGRRTTDQPEDGQGEAAEVLNLRTGPSPSTSFLLARAS